MENLSFFSQIKFYTDHMQKNPLTGEESLHKAYYV